MTQRTATEYHMVDGHVSDTIRVNGKPDPGARLGVLVGRSRTQRPEGGELPTEPCGDCMLAREDRCACRSA
jgi:hypothetical protein